MKKLLLMAVLAMFSVNTFAQGIKFEQDSFDEALAKAKAEEKLLFIDFYTTWCGPCKMMSKDIFPKEKVGKYFNEKFVSLKVDAEKGEGIELAKKYEVKGFPTLIFINPDGTEKKRLVGATPDADFFISFAKQVMGEETPFEEKYEAYQKGNRNLDFVRDVILSGRVYASTLPREEQMPWFKKFREMADWYFLVKRPNEMINAEDFKLIAAFLDGPNNGKPIVEHIYNNYEAYKEVIDVKDLTMFIMRTNNQSIHHAYRAGDLKFREYVEAINGRLAQAHKDAEANDTYKVMQLVAEGGYCLYGLKDLDAYMDWSDKYFVYTKENAEIKSYSYSTPAGTMYQVAKDEITPVHAKRMLKHIKAGLKQFPDDTQLMTAKGDYSALLGDKKTAIECYNKVIELSKGQRYEKYFTEEMTKKIEELK